jgi:hypothetical protein
VPRIVPMNDTEAGLYDLVGGLSGGFVQGATQQLMTQQERDRQQREAAYGNPYQRAARLTTWNSLPEDVRSSANAPLLQNLVAGGADPLQVIGAHRELESDPVYGDSKTRASRDKALQVALRSGQIAEDDEATKEAFRRGEMTLGKMLARRDQKADKAEERTYSEGRETTKRQAEQEEDATRAGQLQEALGVGREQPRPPVTIPTGGANFTQVPLPPKPAVRFSNPQDVVAVANQERGQHSLELRKQKAAEAKQALTQAAGRVDLTPEQRQKVQTALEVMNDQGASEAEYAQAFMVAREFGFAPQAAAIQKQSPQEETANRLAMNELSALQDIQTKMMGPDGRKWMAAWAERFKIPPAGVDPTTGLPAINKEAVFKHLAETIAQLKQQATALPQQPAQAAPTDSPDPEAAAAVDALLRQMQK